MSGKACIIVGARGSGKTTTAKELVKYTHENARLIYDVNAEYKELYPHPFMDFEKFTAKLDATRNGFILIEEATIFLSNRGNNFDIRSALVKARHNSNTFVFVFHSFRSIPIYIFNLCDYIYIHKTNDTTDVIQKFDNPRLMQYFEHVKNAPWNTNADGKRYSPKVLFSIQD